MIHDCGHVKDSRPSGCCCMHGLFWIKFVKQARLASKTSCKDFLAMYHVIKYAYEGKKVDLEFKQGALQEKSFEGPLILQIHWCFSGRLSTRSKLSSLVVWLSFETSGIYFLEFWTLNFSCRTLSFSVINFEPFLPGIWDFFIFVLESDWNWFK